MIGWRLISFKVCLNTWQGHIQTPIMWTRDGGGYIVQLGPSFKSKPKVWTTMEL